jgi:hypothetical protein
LSGLIFGWLRSVHPNFGNIPGAGLWVFNNVGLSMFAGVVAIQAGPQCLQGLREAGVILLVAGVIVTIVPMFFALRTANPDCAFFLPLGPATKHPYSERRAPRPYSKSMLRRTPP